MLTQGVSYSGNRATWNRSVTYLLPDIVQDRLCILFTFQYIRSYPVSI
jgi:hypothetical protein